jgi:hypothetical protein
MIRIMLITVFAAATATAAENPDVLKMKNGVTFPHKNHQITLKGECKNCHRKEIVTGHIEGFSKDAAHRMCRTCHAMKQTGPASCRDCHKKA